MNDEIKEILDAWRNKKYILAYTFNYNSAREQNDKILDYITNLQAELHEIIDNADWWHNRFKAVQQENEKLKELCDKYEEEHDSTFITWQETMRRHYEAIKYIKNNKLVDVDILLDILEGKDEE